MGFLDRINTNKAAATTEGVKKPNPLAAKKPNPLAARKPSIPLKPAAKQEAPAETKEEKVTTAPVEEATAPAAEETVVETKQEAVVEETPVTENKEEASQEEVAAVEEKVKAVMKNPAPAETKETTEETTSEESPKTQDKPKGKSNNRRNTSSNKKKETASTQEEEITFHEIPTTEIDYVDAVEAIRSPFKDEKWEAFKAEIQEDLANINVTDDLNPGTLKVIIAELSILRDKIWFPLQEAKMEFERYASKEPEGLIERVKRINSTGGNNETERRRAGVLACMSYETSAGSVNLYELMDESRERYAFLRAADESIKFKKDILITMNGALKLEKELL